MRKFGLLILVTVLVVVAGAAVCVVRARQVEPLTVQVNGEEIVLRPGENITPEEYALVQDPALLAQSEWVQVDGFWALIAKGVTTPLEVEQIIRPDGAPEFPSDTAWVYVQGEALPVEVPVPLEIPAAWTGKVEARVEGSSVFYDYSANAEMKAKLFSITAYTEAQWQAAQGQPLGEVLLAYGGIVWVYNPALENLYTGQQADEFQQMVGEAYDVARSLATFFIPAGEMEEARQALLVYLVALKQGDYVAAAQMYSGDYAMLAEYNPTVDLNSHAELLEAACTVNGYVCNLEVGSWVEQTQLSDQAFRFVVEFRNPDGARFELGPCCDAVESGPGQTQFEFTVQLQDGYFRVLELPVYAP